MCTNMTEGQQTKVHRLWPVYSYYFLFLFEHELVCFLISGEF